MKRWARKAKLGKAGEGVKKEGEVEKGSESVGVGKEGEVGKGLCEVDGGR